MAAAPSTPWSGTIWLSTLASQLNAFGFTIGPGEVLNIDNTKQESLHLQCGSNAATIAVIDTDSLAASGITAQPPGQPVKPGF